MPVPLPDKETLQSFSAAGVTDLYNAALNERTSLAASVNEDNATIEQVERLEELTEFLTAASGELAERQAKAERLKAATAAAPPLPVPMAEEEEEREEETPGAVTAEAPVEYDTGGAVKKVQATVTVASVGNTETEVVEATVTAAGAVPPRRSVGISDVAPLSPDAQTPEGGAPYTIIAASDVGVPMGSELDWKTLGKAFVERTRSHEGMRKTGVKTRIQHSLATIRRDFPAEHHITDQDDHGSAFAKLKAAADSALTLDAVTAANGWCAPSEPDYSICSPIATDGLLSIPERVLRRGGLIHNQGLDFADFFGNDFTLPIPGYNILTEAQVIADTAKTCVEIPCPDFVDDRLNVAALCLTSSLLQNRGYPEFVSEFTQGAIASMAHLVNREVINEIEAGSTAVNLSAVDPWGTDGTVWSQIISVMDFIATDIRTIYRTNRNQRVDFVLPQWLPQAIRSDWLRRNATHTEDLTDAMVNGAISRRNLGTQWVYDWQDAFDPANGAGAIPATNQMGAATPAFNNPTNVTILAFLPGTWVLGRQDVIRLDTVYDSTNLQQNLVTQLFMEDGFRPMRMCQHSRAYTVTICASGSTGVQRAVACADVTP